VHVFKDSASGNFKIYRKITKLKHYINIMNFKTLLRLLRSLLSFSPYTGVRNLSSILQLPRGCEEKPEFWPPW